MQQTDSSVVYCWHFKVEQVKSFDPHLFLDLFKILENQCLEAEWYQNFRLTLEQVLAIRQAALS